MAEIPVYLINGFLESGKTKFIRETIHDREFSDGKKTLLLVCEEGVEEYDTADLAGWNAEAVYLEEAEDLNEEALKELNKKYKPARVLIEYNGTWKMDDFFELEFPKSWIIVQVLTLADGSTFTNYWNNMRSMMADQLRYSDTIILNRCPANTDKGAIRRSIKPLNGKAQIIYEAADGVELGDESNEPLFDVSQDPIVIEDEDFGLWYIDAMDFPERYRNKRVKIHALVYRDKSTKQGSFIPGRFAMTCCADDIAYVGFVCHVDKKMEPLIEFDPKQKKWVTVTAIVRYEYRPEYKGEGPVLYAQKMEEAKAANEEIVYFN